MLKKSYIVDRGTEKNVLEDALFVTGFKTTIKQIFVKNGHVVFSKVTPQMCVISKYLVNYLRLITESRITQYNILKIS